MGRRRRVRLALVAAAGVAVAAIALAGWGVVQVRDAQARERAEYRAWLAPMYVGHYRPAGYYVGPLRSNIDPPQFVLAGNGLPVVRYPELGYRTNPVSIEQYGLFGWDELHRDGSPAGRAIALRAADWLVAHQDRAGAWRYWFPDAGNGWALRPAWASAMAQGQAMSLLERVYRLTGRRVYLIAALRALRPLERRVELGGLTECFRGDCAHPFYEEYPTRPPSYVLNGFMFTLVGLYDLASVAPSSPAGELYRAGRRTLTAVLPLYDDGGRALYDLTAPGGSTLVASLNYQAIHVYLLRALDSIAPQAELRHYADRWAKVLD